MGGPPRGLAVRHGGVLAAVRNDLRAWRGYVTPWVCLGLAVGAVELALTGRSLHSVFRQALGGPAVVVVDGRFQVAPGWTWFLTGLLFVVASTVLVDSPSAWARLTLVRHVSPRAWVVARLAALGLGAGAYLTGLVAAMSAAMLFGHPGPLARASSLWDIGLWALGLVSLGWCAFALVLTTGRKWPGFVVPVVLLTFARFGGNLSPYMPFAQSIVGLHGWPGTLSVAAGSAYVLTWIVLCGTAALLAADALLRQHD